MLSYGVLIYFILVKIGIQNALFIAVSIILADLIGRMILDHILFVINNVGPLKSIKENLKNDSKIKTIVDSSVTTFLVLGFTVLLILMFAGAVTLLFYDFQGPVIDLVGYLNRGSTDLVTYIGNNTEIKSVLSSLNNTEEACSVFDDTQYRRYCEMASS